MSTITAETILNLIEQLPPTERTRLDQLLAQQTTEPVKVKPPRAPAVAGKPLLIRCACCCVTWSGEGTYNQDVPKVREWKHASLPAHLSEAERAQVLAACALETAMGRRNYVLLLLLSRLGLRACEVTSLRIDDIDWASGAIPIRSTKTHRERRLPLPQEVGQALIEYLRHGRPKGVPHRAIFLTLDAPFSPFRDSSAVGGVVRREMKRAHIARRSTRAHLFRHTAATQMVRRGASFKEIAVDWGSFF